MTTTTHTQRPVLIIGATGKTGRRVAGRLAGLGVPTRLASRSGAIRFDWTDRTTWRPALDGAGAVYITYQPDLIVERSADDLRVFVEVARDANVDKLVLLSGRGEPEARACEEIALHSGLVSTVLRCSWFAQNFSESFLADGVREGAVVLPVDKVGEPFIDADDIADAAVTVLTKSGHDGRVYELTGPRLLTFAEATAQIATAANREIDYVTVSLDDYRAGMAEAGVPDDYADMVISLFGTLFDGRNATTTDGVRELLGRAPTDFADFIEKSVVEGAWFDGASA
ncbi:Rossmann-fold NAD(P)-binding domain-containing protein [Williamsia muralis]|uniref:NmrA family transcriptional regulator n=1 Tax=Williamsia marianensis TaxID=85044 RepID=A0ABU4EVQ3_WILMA|nr:NmrA family transcriptional regulator [Williamsia muralis]MDV7134811.1 NmrA family transcriptional regulator [Williamsia muralis]